VPKRGGGVAPAELRLGSFLGMLRRGESVKGVTRKHAGGGRRKSETKKDFSGGKEVKTLRSLQSLA